MNEPLIVSPKNFTLSSSDAKRKSWQYVLIFLGVSLVFFVLFLTRRRHDPTASILIVIICAMGCGCYIMFSRYPTKIQIFYSSQILIADYLDGFGVEKQDTISLNDVFVRYAKRYSKSLDQNDMQTRVTQSVFNNWIYIDKTHGFSQEQIKFIYDSIKSIS